METQTEQELKAERVQEELMAAEEPYRISLKAERVQEPSAAFELTVPQEQPMTIALLGLQVVITLHGTNAGQAG